MRRTSRNGLPYAKRLFSRKEVLNMLFRLLTRLKSRVVDLAEEGLGWLSHCLSMC